MTAQLYRKDLGKYGGHSGVNKLYHILSAIDLGIAHIGWVKLINAIQEDMKEMKKFEEETNNKTLYSHLKDWNQIFDKLQELRPQLALVQQRYDEIHNKKMEGKKEMKKIIRLKRIVKKVSVYQPELYYVLNIINKISNMQMSIIPAEYFRTPETSEYLKNPFLKAKSPQTIVQEAPAIVDSN